jgi:pimeloyl-ACP methyl ester carboxylesterase
MKDRLTITAPGVDLYVETRGEGPPLLMIHGAGGNASSFLDLPDLLADTYTVITYDRRGYARSIPVQPSTCPVQDSSDDAHCILQALAPHGAYVFAFSAGAITGLNLLARHPSLVNTLIAYEPLTLSVLPDPKPDLQFFEDVFAVYRQQGALAAIGMLTRTPTFAGLDAVTANVSEAPPGFDYAFETEMKPALTSEPDLTALRTHKHKLILAVGQDHPDSLGHRISTALARHLGTATTPMPGGHCQYMLDPVGFADRLRALLRHDPLPKNAASGRPAPTH